MQETHPCALAGMRFTANAVVCLSQKELSTITEHDCPNTITDTINRHDSRHDSRHFHAIPHEIGEPVLSDEKRFLRWSCELLTPLARCPQGYNQGLVTQTITLRDRLRRIFLAIVLLALATALLTFGVDFAIFRLRLATNRNPYGSVVVTRYYAVAQKNGKTQFIFDPPAPETCVQALFPHAGVMPCWYLTRHPEQRTDI